MMNKRTTDEHLIKEAVRYLGYGRHAIDERTLELIHSSFEELEQVADVRFIYRIFEISFLAKDELVLGNLKINSKNLYKNLQGCKQAIVLGITLGAGVDRLLKRYSLTDMSYVVVLQACAAALLEAHCDKVEMIAKGQLGENLYFRPRFSPGYGDFSILHQKELLQMIDASKRIGLTMTEGYMLTPTKSVTALIGISELNQNCNQKGCEVCNKTDCIYRRDGNNVTR